MYLRTALFFLLFTTSSSCTFGQSFSDSTYGKDCRNVPLDSFSKIRIDGITYSYFQCDKSYYYTDKKNKHHYTGEFIIPYLTKYKIVTQQKIAQALIRQFRIDKIAMFETCTFRNLEKMAIRLPDSTYKEIEKHSFRSEIVKTE